MKESYRAVKLQIGQNLDEYNTSENTYESNEDNDVKSLLTPNS